MTTSVPLLARDQVERLPERARAVVEYRKSGLSLNHIQGCPLDCAYCIRHTYGLWDQRQPRALMSDAEAVEQLVGHRYFQAHVTPLQLFNRATDPFLPVVRPHTLAILEDLDGRGLRNHVLVITRHQMRPSDVERLNWARCRAQFRAPACIPANCSGSGGLPPLWETTPNCWYPIVTNAVQITQADARNAPVRLWLLADRTRLLILVWDASPLPPVCMSTSDDAENGRGLLLVETLSTRWDFFAHQHGGKVVWAALDVA